MKATDTRLILLLEPTPEDPDTEFLFRSQVGAFNEYFSRNQSKQSAYKMQKVAEDNFHTGSIPPYGYKSVPLDDSNTSRSRKKLIKDESEADTVELIFKLAETGDNGIRFGLKKIASRLNELGRTKRGKVWTTNDVHKILTNTAYYGERQFGLKRKRPDINNDIVIQKIPPYISKETFYNIRELQAKNAPIKNNHQPETLGALLTGIAKCDKCGASLKIVTGKSGRYRYYACRTKINSSVKKCDSKQIPQQELEVLVVNTLREKVLSESNLKLVVSTIRDELKERNKKCKSEALNLEHKKSIVISKYDRLVDLIASGELEPNDKLRISIKTYDSQIKDIEQQLEIQKKYASLPLKNFGNQQTICFAKAVEAVLLDKDHKACKALIRAIVSEIRVDTEIIKVNGKVFKLMGVLSAYERGHQRFLVPTFMTNWRSGRDSNPRPPA